VTITGLVISCSVKDPELTTSPCPPFSMTVYKSHFDSAVLHALNVNSQPFHDVLNKIKKLTFALIYNVGLC
jgi:hypothetical protein